MGSILDLFVGGFGALWVPLGSLLGSLEALLGGLRTQKPSKTGGFLRFLKMQLFGSLKLLMALLGSSCHWAQKLTFFWLILDKFLGSKMLKKYPNTYQKLKNKFKTQKKWHSRQVNIKKIEGQFWNTKWTRLFAQNPNQIYKTNQDEPKNAILSCKKSNTSH